MVDIGKLGAIFGDRLLVRRLERPEKIRGIMIPTAYAKDKTREQDLWWGVIERFGLDSKVGDAYGLAVGDIVGFESAGQHSSNFEGTDGQLHVWVAEEFAVVKDIGRVAAFRAGEPWTGSAGVQPLGAFVAIMPDAEKEMRGGLHIPDSAKSATHTGTVLAVSTGAIDGSELKALDIKTGDVVLYGKYSGCFARLGGRDILFARQEDIIGLLVGSEAAVPA